MHHERDVEIGAGPGGEDEIGRADRWELGHPGVGQEALEPAHPVGGELGHAERVDGPVDRHRAAPEGDVDRHPTLGRRPFHRERRGVDRGRNAVERHVDERGDPTGRRGTGGAGEALPVGAAGLVDVDVAVDQTGQEHLVVGEVDDAVRADVRVVLLDADDPPVVDDHRGGSDATGENGPARTDHEHRGSLTSGEQRPEQ